ncbi:cyclin-dependent kinase inhibitor 1C-like isoform X2 [Lucilia cuprina]|uniref:cyclin-dependent kinase inhibitor 1C-like isoform X2 n=1 Tax=Lucilia cuprina TaxID=7375 RepID=UPI001F05925D|nr:cyclin-dependent kinase inhibitor 1C-like isoform X2 [Lucilia cuprina]
MDALTIAMEDALLESDKEVMEVEDQGSKVATVADPAPVPAPAAIPDPVSAPTPFPTPTPTPTLASALAPELPALMIACPDTAAAPPTIKSSKKEYSGSKVSESSKSKCLQYEKSSKYSEKEKLFRLTN